MSAKWEQLYLFGSRYTSPETVGLSFPQSTKKGSCGSADARVVPKVRTNGDWGRTKFDGHIKGTRGPIFTVGHFFPVTVQLIALIETAGSRGIS